jgi:glutaredoxin
VVFFDVYRRIRTTGRRKELSMKQVKAFILSGCPYCKKARLAYNELCENNASYREVPVDWILEDQQPDIADQYDYYYTPTMYVDEQKVYESHPGQTYEEIRDEVEKVLKAALA